MGNTTLISRTREGQLKANFVESEAFNNRIDLPERYEILNEIGSGGMGVIYKGKHRTTGADIAIKVMHPRDMTKTGHLQRFQQEARTAATLRHPNIVLVHDFGVTEHSIAFLVMEWLEGPTLENNLKQEGKLSLQRFLNIFEQCASALALAHKNGIIHRDIKPSNIILTKLEDREDVVKIVDFGIAKVLATEDEETLNLTQTGEILGSPKFMSPEQCMGKAMDYRSDIYSLGCVMYEAIVGVAPLTAENSAQMFFKHMFEMPARPTSINPQLEMPELIEPLLFKTLQKEPDMRYGSMEELENDLKRVRLAMVPLDK
jgi:serine/threonine-protein kinase